MKRRCLSALIAATTTLLATVSHAAPFEPSRVARDATWVLHVDTQQVVQSKLWDVVQGAMDERQHLRMTAGLELMKDQTGVDLLTDLHDVTLYGHSFDPNTAVLLLHGDWDPAQLTGVIQNARDYQALKHNEHAVHRWTDEDDARKSKFGAFVGSDLIVVGETEKAVTDALDVLDDEPNKALRADDGPARPTEGGVMAFVTASGLDALRATGKVQSPIFNRVKAGWISVAEQDEKLALHANIQANSPQAARQVLNALNGLRSIVTMSVPDTAPPAARTGIDLLDAATVTLDDDNVVIDWPVPLESVKQLAVEVQAERGGRRALIERRSTTSPTTQP